MVGSPPTPAPRVAPTSFGTLQLRLTSGAQQGRIVELAARRCSIGSAARCTLRLRAAGIQPIHCLIDRSGQTTLVRRHAGETALNGQSFEQAALNVGDRLRLGPLEFEVVVDQKPQAAAPPPAPASTDETVQDENAQAETTATTSVSQSAPTTTTTYTDQFRQLDARFEDLEQRLTELGRTLTTAPTGTTQADAMAQGQGELGQFTNQAMGQIASQLNEQLAAQANAFSSRLASDSATRIDELARHLQDEWAQARPGLAAQAAEEAAERLSQQLPEEVRRHVSTQLDVAAERLSGQLAEELSGVAGELGEQLTEKLVEHVNVAIAHRVPLEVALQLWELSDEFVDKATAAATARVSEKLAARLDPEIARRLETETSRLQETLQRSLTERLTPEIARQVSAELAPRLTASLAHQVTEQFNGELTADATQRVAAEVTTRVLAEVGSRIEPELAARLVEEVTGQVADILSPRIDDGLASWEAERANWIERQQEMQTQIAAHTEQLDSRLRSIVELQQVVESQCQQLRQPGNDTQPPHDARLEQIERSLEELRQQQADWTQQRNQWQDELRQVRDELSERAEKTRSQVSKLEARWETFEDEQRHRQTDHEHSTSEQIDQRLAGIRAEREAFESERQHDRTLIHPGEHVRQIDERLAEIQARRVPNRDRQSTWQDKPQPGEAAHLEDAASSGPAPAVSADLSGDAETQQKPVAAPDTEPPETSAEPPVSGTSVAIAAEAVASEAVVVERDEAPVEAPAQRTSEVACGVSEETSDARTSEPAEEISFQQPSEQSPASVLEMFAHLQPQGATAEASPAHNEPVAAPRQPAATLQSAPAQPDVPATESNGNDDEESIEAYMARLMQRVRTVAEEPVKATSGQGASSRATPAPAAPSRQVAEPEPAPAPEEPQPIVDLSELAPRSLPAESTSNISAMRDLANSSARTAIDVHQRKRMTAVIYSKLAVAASALSASVALAWMSSNNKPVSYAAALVAMVVGVVWGLEYLVLTGSRLFKSSKSTSNKQS